MGEIKTGAEAVHWNLSDLCADAQEVTMYLTRASDAAESFAARYRGHVAGLDAEGLAGALAKLADIHDDLGRVYTYAYLHWVTQTDDPERGAQLQRVREAYTQASQHLIFFDLEWTEVDEEPAHRLMEGAALQPFRHYLELTRLQKPHLLSEPEEKILQEKAVTGRSAWNRYFDETVGAMRFVFEGETITEQEILAKLHAPDRSVRAQAAETFTAGLLDEQRTLTFIFNTLLADKATNDRLRGYPRWISSRNRANEVKDATVDALIEAVTGRYDLAARYYRLKRELLGFDELYDYDRYAPLAEADTRYDWSEARSVVTAAYGDFHPQMGDIVQRFFKEAWIDAAVTPGKRGGAFSHGAVPSVHPYILMNFTGRIRDVQTLAHELGHGVHQYLSRKQGVLQAGTPLTTAETASVFGEMLVFQRLLQAQSDPANRLAMLVGKIDDTMATVFRQVSMNRFEERMHTTRRAEGELSAAQFGQLWRETQEALYQDSVTLGDHYDHWWSYIPHFLHTPGYVYAYAFGELLVLALYERYQAVGPDFAGEYLTLLEAGGSDWPHVLVGRLGIDLTDLGFWKSGLGIVERLIEDAEALYASLDTTARA